jgi:hypothetical protein
MTRKTGAKAVKARQLTRAAKVHRYKQKLKDAGESLSLPKPSREAQRQKDAELKKLYLEFVSKKEEQPQGKTAQSEQPAEQPEKEQVEQQAEQRSEQKGQPHKKTEEQAEPPEE